MRRRCGIGEGSDRHAVIFEKGEWVAIFCPKAGREIPARPPVPSRGRTIAKSKLRFTRRQGQALAFIYAYTKLNRRPPAEADIAAHFRIAAPSAHGLVLSLAKAGLITRQPGQARSIQLRVEPDSLPTLE